jgi:DNA replication and repair protein RecF
LERDIILQKTQIWPHIDDFEIRVDGINVTHYASRWEIKSIIIYLKLLEWLFIEKKTWKKPIMLIDDLLSELDDLHKNMLLKKIEYYQTFISSIYKIEFKIYRFVFKLHFL